MAGHYIIRILALTITIISLNSILSRTAVRLDVTAEGLHSLSKDTIGILKNLDPEQPIFIQAFISPEVPDTYVQTRANLLDVLKEIDSASGPRVQVRLVTTEMYSPESREARQRFGIKPRFCKTNCLQL